MYLHKLTLLDWFAGELGQQLLVLYDKLYVLK